MTKQQQIEEVLKALRQEVGDITGVVLASADGLLLATDLGENEAARGAAMAATASGLGRRITETLNLGVVQELVVRGDDGYLVVYRVAEKGVLGVVARAGANLGLIHLEARNAAAKLAAVLG